MQVTARAKALNLPDWRPYLEPVNAEWADEGAATSGAAYAEAIAILHGTSRALGAFFTRHDLYLSPPPPPPPPPNWANSPTAVTAWTRSTTASGPTAPSPPSSTPAAARP